MEVPATATGGRCRPGRTSASGRHYVPAHDKFQPRSARSRARASTVEERRSSQSKQKVQGQVTTNTYGSRKPPPLIITDGAPETGVVEALRATSAEPGRSLLFPEEADRDFQGRPPTARPVGAQSPSPATSMPGSPVVLRPFSTEPVSRPLGPEAARELPPVRTEGGSPEAASAGSIENAADAKLSQEKLTEAKRTVDACRDARDQLQLQLHELRANRESATSQLRLLMGRPLAEIKGIVKSPPDPVRRALAAVWLLLHCERYVGKSAVVFDERREWPRVQRMVVDDSFVPHILAFSPERLELAPEVLKHLRSTCLGWRGEGDAEALPPVRLQEKPQSVPASRLGMRLQSQSATNATKGRAPLDVETVDRASRPVGLVFRWLLALISEQQGQSQLLSDLSSAEAQLKAAQQRFDGIALKLAEFEADAAMVRIRASRKPEVRPQTAEIVRVERAAAQKWKRPFSAPEAPAKPPPPPKEVVLDMREVLRRKVHGEFIPLEREPVPPSAVLAKAHVLPQLRPRSSASAGVR